MKFCKYCGSQIEDDSKFCPSCGANLEGVKPQGVSEDLHNMVHPTEQPNSSPKSRAIAAVLAWFTGIVGGHLYYLGKTSSAVVMTIFFWTGIPAIISIIHFILILCGEETDSEGRKVINW